MFIKPENSQIYHHRALEIMRCRVSVQEPSIPLSLKWKIPQIQQGLLHTLTYTPKLTVRDGYERNFTGKKRDDFNFTIANFPFLRSNIPAAPAYEAYIPQLIRYSRACGSFMISLRESCCWPESYWTKGL